MISIKLILHFFFHLLIRIFSLFFSFFVLFFVCVFFCFWKFGFFFMLATCCEDFLSRIRQCAPFHYLFNGYIHHNLSSLHYLIRHFCLSQKVILWFKIPVCSLILLQERDHHENSYLGIWLIPLNLEVPWLGQKEKKFWINYQMFRYSGLFCCCTKLRF